LDPEVKAGGDGRKAAPAATGGPVEIGMLVRRYVQLVACDVDYVEPDDAPACGSPDTRIPAVATGEQITAEPDRQTMSDREAQPVRDQSIRENLVGRAGFDEGELAAGEQLDPVEVAEIQEQAPIAQAGTSPAVSPRLDRDPAVPSMSPGHQAGHFGAIPGA